MRPRGFSLIELVVAAALSSVVLAAIFSIFMMAARVDEEETARQDLRIDAMRSLEEIVRFLKTSGPADINGDLVPDYPTYFSDGTASGMNAFLAHPAPTHAAVPGDDDFGPTVEMAFKLPQDLDGNGVPTNAAGAVEWSPDTYAITLVPSTAFGNEVLLRTFDSAGAIQRSLPIARYVERLLVETKASNPALGPNQLRITLWFRRPAPRGMLLKHQAFTSVNLRSLEQ
ncbi:MAG TPA: prepilin-type N-terminal cleavage/methylation domain-containing protein [Planctomycetota bacterium]|nr:prepilin-type N-terminal cleavage/methylation domain-containing protein [Planctomycetota bacterium]